MGVHKNLDFSNTRRRGIEINELDKDVGHGGEDGGVNYWIIIRPDLASSPV